MRKTFLLVLSSLISTWAFCQLNFTNYTSFNETKELLELGDNIWLGTPGGIAVRNKSNGAVVATYTTNNGMSNNYVKDMAKDMDGNVWVMTNYGISVYSSGTWKVYTEKNSSLTEAASKSLTSVCVDLIGNIWIGTAGQGIYLHVPGENTWKNLKESHGLANNQVNDIAVDQSNTKWIATEAGLCRYDGDIWFTIMPEADFQVVHVDIENRKWTVDNKREGVSFLDGMNWVNLTVADGLVSNQQIRDIASNALGNVYIASTSGVSVFVHGTGFVAEYTTSNSDIESNHVDAVMADGQGNTWFGTKAGVSRYDGNAWVNYHLENSLAHNIVNDAITLDSGTTYFATMQGLSQLKGASVWQNFYSELPSLEVNCLEIDGQGKLWVGTANGIKRYSNPNWTNASLAGLLIRDMEINTANGDMWLATGAGVMKKNAMETILYLKDTTAFETDKINQVILDENGFPWAASDAGIGYFDGDSWKLYTTADGLPNDVIHSVAIDNNGTVFCGTFNGVAEFDGTANWQVVNLDLQSNKVNDISFDPLNNMWIATESGLAIFNGTNLQKYNIPKGLVEDRCDRVYLNGHIRWACTKNGVSKITTKIPGADFSFDTICYSPSSKLTSFTNQSTEKDLMTTYQWDIDNDGSIEYHTPHPQHDFQGHGVHDVKLIVSNYNRHDTVVKSVLIGSEPNVQIAPAQVSVCDGNEVELRAKIINSDPIFNYTYEWSTGETTKKILLDQTDTISVSVNAFNCQGNSGDEIVKFIKPYDQLKICMVSVDSVTGKNEIMWERPQRDDIRSFTIYKVLGTNFIPVGEVLWDEMTRFVDFQSTPANVAARYAIATVDTCGNESALSPYHQTIHLSSSVGASTGTYELLWNHYEDESGTFVPDFYYVYRGNDESDMQMVQKVDGINTSYTDDNPTEERFYKIAVVKPGGGCLLSDTRLKANSGPFSRSLSNLEDNRLQSTSVTGGMDGLNSMKVFPNPMAEVAYIRFPNPGKESYKLNVLDITGKVVNTIPGITGNQVALSRENLGAGIYILRLEGDKNYHARIVVE